jgi:hypothetical protein
MRLDNILLFSLIGLAAAAPSPTRLGKRDLSTFTTAFNAVGSALSAFDTDVKTLTSSSDIPAVITTLTTDANNIISALNTGATNINATAPLSLTDSLNLLTLSNNLVSTANTTITDLISKHDIIVNAGETDFVVTELQAVKAATYGFIGAVVSHVPDSVKSIANNQASQVVTVLNNGITAFGGTVTRRGLVAML